MKNEELDVVIAGGGIAGLVSALELLTSGKSVTLIDRDMPEKLGGLARWAFGGMALSGTPQQRKMNIQDNAEILLADWKNFAEFSEEDYWPKAWAKEYAENNYEKIYLWLKQLGLTFLPAVNWVERGLDIPGNSVPRYHILWGTGWQLVETVIKQLMPFVQNKQLVLLHQHKVNELLVDNHRVIGCKIENEQNKRAHTIYAKNTIVATGGINGSLAKVIENWPYPTKSIPEAMLNGANPISDGNLHECTKSIGGHITHANKMWNYAAGIAHTQPDFEGHGLSLIPCKSALWVNFEGKRIGPKPLITGFDTHFLCHEVLKYDKPWTWQILNWDIAKKELAISGSLHNPSIKNKKIFSFLKEIIFGNTGLIRQLEDESIDFITADSPRSLVNKMNELTTKSYINEQALIEALTAFDEELAKPRHLQTDEQIMRIHQAREWKADKLRTCKPKPILSAKKNQKLIAIRLHFISRKSLGGIQTNLQSQVLTQEGAVIPHLYSVGEAAGFGGGGANGKRSLEGTFLSGCILTARNAAQAIIKNKDSQ